MDERKNGRVTNRQKVGERVAWKKEKVNKWEMPSYAHAGKSTDPPSQCLHVLEIEGLERQLPASGIGFGRSTSTFLPVLDTQPTLGDPNDSAAFYDLQSLLSKSIEGVTTPE